jgi:hypothetical protein
MSTPTTPGGESPNPSEFELLNSPPTAPDISGELKPKKGNGLGTPVLSLIGVVLLVGGFVGGIAVGKNSSSGKTTPAAAAGANRSRGGFGGYPGGASGGAAGGANGGGGFARGGTVVGTVESVNGNTITIKDNTGKTTTVTVDGTTTITIGKTGGVSDLPAGTEVTVLGTPDSSGGVTARSILSGITGGFGGFGGRGARPSTAPTDNG